MPSSSVDSQAASRLPLSVILITQNEESRLPETLAAVADWADDIVIVDSGSTDKTPDIAASFGARFFHRDWTGYGAQKRYAEEQAKHDWVLNIDADEVVLPELSAEIAALFASGAPDCDGYKIRIHDMILGTNRLTASADYKPVRLYRRSRGRYSDNPVFDRVDMAADARVSTLRGRIAHKSIVSYAQRLQKTNFYTDGQAAEAVSRAARASRFKIVAALPFGFFKNYFLRGYWRYGIAGFIHAVNIAYAAFLKQAKLYAAIHFKQEDR